MDHYERSKLADAIKEEKFSPNDYVIKEVDFKTYLYRVTAETYST